MTAKANHSGLFFGRRQSKVVNFGSYRAWGDGTFATSCWDYLNPSDTRFHSYAGSTGNGVYRIKVSGTTSDVNCDMVTGGGGWQQVATLDPNKILSKKQFIAGLAEYPANTGTNPGVGATIVGIMGKSGYDLSYNQLTASTYVSANGTGTTPGTGYTEMYNYLPAPLWYGSNGITEDFGYVIYSTGEVVRRIFSCSCGSGERSYFYFRVVYSYSVWEKP